jgi:hypothetical protein
MLLGALFLLSSSELDVAAGAAGLLSGSVLFAMGVLSTVLLALARHTPPIRLVIQALVPSFLAALAWPVTILVIGPLGVLFVVPVLLPACLVLAWRWSHPLADRAHLYTNWGRWRTRAVLFGAQALVIVGTWPAFVTAFKLIAPPMQGGFGA